MMKIFLFVVFLCMAFSISSCNRDDIDTFHGERQIYFEKFYMNALAPGTEGADTTSTSFFFVGDDAMEMQVKLVVNLSGPLPEHDLKFGLRAVEEESTAEAGEYVLSEEYVFHARPIVDNQVDLKDTIEVTLKRSPRLDAAAEKGLQLVVELVPSEDLALGQFERRRAVIVWTNVLGEPEWWDYEVEYMLLGKYSYEKYKLFVEVIPGAAEVDGTMIQESPAKVIGLVSQFRQWLIEHLNDPESGALYQRIYDSLP